MKSFEYWQYEDLELTFGLERLYEYEPLSAWLSEQCEIIEPAKSLLDTLQQELIQKADAWNEDELKFFFISQVIFLVNFSGKKFNAFTQRPLAAKKKDVHGNEVELKGRVEFMVATGKQNPREPFFFLHEYKPEKRRDTDPLGQLLSAMLAARALNQVKHTLYGCYVIGRNWFFVILEGDKYCVSQAFDATQDDLFRIYCILKACRRYVEQLAG
jgi:hypothetical protein